MKIHCPLSNLYSNFVMIWWPNHWPQASGHYILEVLLFLFDCVIKNKFLNKKLNKNSVFYLFQAK